MGVKTFHTPDGTVTIEAVSHIVRYHVDGYGSPFTFVCTMAKYGNEATLFAGLGKMTAKVRRAIRAALKEMGITEVRYERRNLLGSRKAEQDAVVYFGLLRIHHAIASS